MHEWEEEEGGGEEEKSGTEGRNDVNRCVTRDASAHQRFFIRVAHVHIIRFISRMVCVCAWTCVNVCICVRVPAYMYGRIRFGTPRRTTSSGACSSTCRAWPISLTSARPLPSPTTKV